MTTEFTKNIELIQKLKSTYLAAGMDCGKDQTFIEAAVQYIENAPTEDGQRYLESVIRMAFTDGFLSAVACFEEPIHPLDIEHHFQNFKELFGPQRWNSDFCKCGMLEMNCQCDGSLSEPLPEIGGMKDEVKLEWKHDFNDAMKKLCVEIEDIKKLVTNQQVEITGTPVGEYKVEVKLGDEHLEAIDRQNKLRAWITDMSIRVDHAELRRLLEELHPAEDASGLFGMFQGIETAPEVKAEPINERCWDRCALRGCAARKRCQNPKNCDGRFPERNPMTPVPTIHGMIVRHKTTDNVLKAVHEQFSKWTFKSGEEAYKWLWSITMQPSYEYSLLVSDDECIWRNYDENRDEPHEEIWRVAVAPRYDDIARRLTETERQFLHRAIKELTEIRHRERLPMHETAGAFSHFRTAEEHLVTIALDTYTRMNKKSADMAAAIVKETQR